MISIINAGPEEGTPLIHDKKPSSDGFGKKTIGFAGGLSLLINNIIGPAMVTIPLVYQNAGWFTPTLCLILMTLLTGLTSGFICEAIACIPGNEHFEGRVEFTTLVNFFFGRSGMIFSQVFINAALQSANIAAIIECAQVADSTFIAVFKTTCGLQVYPHFFKWTCVHTPVASDSPFTEGYYLFTLGFLLMMLIVIPMGYLNLDDNIIVQYVAEVFLLVVTIDFLVAFIMHGFTLSNVPFVGKSQAMVLGQLMANYTYVTTIPSWCSEKKPEVSVNKSIWIATIVATTVYFIIGFFGALSYVFPADGDVLSVINASPQSNIFDRILVYLFPVLALASTIPVFCIIVRYNLLQNKICPKGIANFVAVVLPWLLVIPFLTGSGLNSILNWGTLVFGSVANFIIPLVVYQRAANFRDRASITLTERQHSILKELGLRDNNYFATKSHVALPYQVLPNALSKYSRIIAITCAVVLFVLVIAAIVLNIVISI